MCTKYITTQEKRGSMWGYVKIQQQNYKFNKKLLVCKMGSFVSVSVVVVTPMQWYHGNRTFLLHRVQV